MSIRSLSKLLFSLSMLACSSVFAAPVVFNVTGVQSFGTVGTTGNTIVNLNVGANAHITSIGYDVNLTAFNPSFLSEIGLQFTESTGTDGVRLRPGIGDQNAGTASYADSADLVALALDFFVGADGILRLEFYETFNDGTVSPDGVWNFGTVTFGVEGVDVPPGTDVPEPASLLLLGAGVSALAYSRRRRTAVAA
jgi:hypothetical protein